MHWWLLEFVFNTEQLHFPSASKVAISVKLDGFGGFLIGSLVLLQKTQEDAGSDGRSL